jgi:cell division protein FtsW
MQAGMARMASLFTGRVSGQGASSQGLPVNLGSYDFARTASGSSTRLQSVDQALVWVVVALLMWGMVMVYSASIAMPDNPRFARYAQSHF